MAKLINKTIHTESDNRYWVVERVDEYLGVLYVRELDRQFRTVIRFEEV